MSGLEPLRVATLNMLFDLTFWRERAPLILAGFRALRPHVIALQEVSPQIDNARWLAEELGGYAVYSCPALEHPSSDHLALLARVPAGDPRAVALGAEGRQAHRIVVQHGGFTWTIVNTHFCWNPFLESARVEQAARLLSWLTGAGPIVVCGDFNARPRARSQNLLAERLDSAYRAVHGRDPDYTYPTGLRRGPGLRHASRDVLFRAGGWFSTRGGQPWQTTVDHVLVDRKTLVSDCRIVFDQPALHDPSLFASDHLGLAADLKRRNR